MARRPIAVSPGDDCRAVLRMFRARCIRHAPVVEDGQLIGVVSDRDLLRAVPELIGDIDAELAHCAHASVIAEVMTGDPLTCAPNDAIDVVARRMQELRIGCFPVVSDGVLIGMLTVTDLLRGFTDHLEGEGVRRLNLLWSSGRAQRGPDVAAIAASVGVELTALLSSNTDTGARMHIVRTRADETSFARLVDAYQAAGLLIVGDRAAA
ncbi:MAG: CBS domain-containing protein [Planctomycetota bacterium]